jgi:tetratricopeptide (TPR) repeat protein
MAKITRKEIKRPDQFITKTGKALQFISSKLQAILIGITAIAVAGIVFAIWYFQSEKSENEAFNAFSAGFYEMGKAANALKPQDAQDSENEETGETKVADKSKTSPAPTTAEVAQAYKSAMEKFNEVHSKFSGTAASRFADYYKGVIAFNEGKYSESVNYFNDFMSKSGEPRMKALAFRSMGKAFEAMGKYADAVNSYNSIMESGVNPFEDLLYADLSRAYEKQGNKAKAASMLEEAVSKFENSTKSSEYKARIKTLKGNQG